MAKRKTRASKSAHDAHDRGAETSNASRSAESNRDRSISFVMLLSLICSAAFLLRLVNVLQTIEVPTIVHLMGDAKGYFDWAIKIAGGQWYGTETFYQAPLYPYTLAVLIKFLGCGVFGIRVVQAILGAAGVFLLGIAGRHIFNKPVGLIAAGMYAIYAPAIYYDGIIQKTSLASFLLCASLAACAWLYRRGDGWTSYLTGLTLALLVLTRENALLWLPIIPVWMLIALPRPLPRRLALSGFYCLGLVSILFPVAARNASLGGEWSPTTFQAGPNFYIGNNLESNGLYQPLVSGHETPKYERADAQRLAEEVSGRELSPREVSRFWAERSLAEIKQDPLHWIQLMVIKSFMVINRYEVPDVESMQVFSDYSWPLRLLAPCWNFGILGPLALFGAIVTRRRWRRLWLYHALIFVMTAAVVLFFILGRYREPLVPLLILFAATGLLHLWRIIRAREWSGNWGALLATLVAVIACNLPIHDESMLNASSYMNAGVAAGQEGDIGRSIELLTQAIEAHPEMAEAHVNLGRALDLSNRPQAAIQFYRNALQLDPSLVPADSLLGAVYERLGDFDSALRHYQRALQLDPTDQRAHSGVERLVRGR